MYACSPAWQTWASEADIDNLLGQLCVHTQYLDHLFISGGEPMLKPELTAYTVARALDLGLPLDYVETNAFWCWDEEKAISGFELLRSAGLERVSISISPFHAEFIPLINTEIAMDTAQQVFGADGVMLHSADYFKELHSMDVDDTIEFEHYLEKKGVDQAAISFAGNYDLIPNGRASVALANLYQRRPASSYFGESCIKELGNPHHVNIDHQGNYITRMCTGIVLGSALNLSELFKKKDWSDRPLIQHLLTGGVEALYKWAISSFNYTEDIMGYTSKCHLCLDIRRHLVHTGVDLVELNPKSFYDELEHVDFLNVDFD